MPEDPDRTHTRLSPVRAERRDERRVAVALPASLRTEDLEIEGDLEVLGEVQDASLGGLFIRSQFLEPAGTPVRLRVVTPLCPLVVRGRVAWVRDGAEGAGMGIELDAPSRDVWAQWLPTSA